MFAILRAWVAAFVVLTILYWMLRVYFRSIRREALEQQFEAEGQTGDRDAWVDARLRDYGRSLKITLLWLVYIVPMVAIALIVYFVNYD